MDSLEAEGEKQHDRFAVTVNIQIRFIRSKVKDALAVAVDNNDPKATKIQLTEEDIRTRYPWDYRKLTDECRKRLPGFKEDATYHKVRKAAMTKPQFGIVRLLDPGNPKSSRKPFFPPNIVSEFEKAYAKRKERCQS